MAKRFLSILFMLLFMFSVSAFTAMATELPSSPTADVSLEETPSGATEFESIDIIENESAAEPDNAASLTGETPTEEPAQPSTQPETNPAEKKSIWSYLLIPAIIVAVLGVAAFIILRNPKIRERIKKFFKDYKSEMKKIVWPTRKQVIQNTGIVLVAIIFVALVVGVLDALFGLGISALSKIKF